LEDQISIGEGRNYLHKPGETGAKLFRKLAPAAKRLGRRTTQRTERDRR
jgi:hypothetical protein